MQYSIAFNTYNPVRGGLLVKDSAGAVRATAQKVILAAASDVILQELTRGQSMA